MQYDAVGQWTKPTRYWHVAAYPAANSACLLRLSDLLSLRGIPAALLSHRATPVVRPTSHPGSRGASHHKTTFHLLPGLTVGPREQPLPTSRALTAPGRKVSGVCARAVCARVCVGDSLRFRKELSLLSPTHCSWTPARRRVAAAPIRAPDSAAGVPPSPRSR